MRRQALRRRRAVPAPRRDARAHDVGPRPGRGAALERARRASTPAPGTAALYAGEPLPSFAAVAAFCLRNDFALNVEIKPSPGSERETGRVVAAAAAALWAAAPLPPLLSSFQPDALEGARETAPQLPRALLLDTLRDGWLDEARALGCVAVVTELRADGRRGARRIHGAGMRGLVYTVNDPAEARRLDAFAIDGIITDAVDRFSPGTRVAD